MTRRPVAIDLFCGAGGMSLGFEQAGFDVLLGVDRDGYHVATHERNFPYGKTLCQSVADLNLHDIYAALSGDREVDLICGGPPCQGFSNMGLRDAQDARNSLVGQFVRVVCEVKPKAFAMENVPGMLTGSTRGVLLEAIDQFEAAGYRITHPVKVLDASHFGVPQKRKRLVLLGLRNDFDGVIEYPSTKFEAPSVWEAISDLPDVDADEALFSSNDAPYRQPPVSPYQKTMRGTAVDRSDYSYKRIWNRSVCSGCLRVNHTPKAISLYEATEPGDMVPGHKLPRLDPEGLAPTLRAGSDSSHGSYTAPRPIHPYRPRCITAREACRLHGFPDWFAMYPLKWHAYRQIGNAVCPPMAKAIGERILDKLGIGPEKPKVSFPLTNVFHLPAERPRTLKRIPQVLNFPPVIEKLFASRFDLVEKRLKRPRFTFAEVLDAVRDTGVELTWIRADTFLSEIARSRNVKRLLAPCLDHGYTVRRCSVGDSIGEFIPIGNAAGIDVKQPPKLRKGMQRGQATFFG